MKRARYTSEFKFEAVRLVKTGQSMAVVSSTLNISNQTLYNWVKADRDGNLLSKGSKPVTEEQMELARLRAEVARLKMERDILKNRPTRSAAPLLNRNSGELYCKDRRILAVSFLEVSTPSKNLAWG